MPPPRPQPESTPDHLNASWTLTDLVDFEMLLSQGEGGDEPAWQATWAKRRPNVSHLGAADARRVLFYAWLEIRREEAGTPLPGESIASGWRWLGTLGTVIGLLLGGSVTGGLLHYRGDEPVNVAWFLGGTVGLQWALLLAAVIAGLLRTATGIKDAFRPLHHLVSGLAWLCSTGLRRLPGEQRNRLRAHLARLGRKREIYGSLTTWPFLVVTQLFAVGYNVGVLSVLLTHVAATDLAFGWQSTLDLSPEAAHRIVSALASPWAWFAPNPHPTLSEIVGSRFSFSAGIAGMDRAAMASWWPFLVYSVAVYGLLVRAALLVFASIRLRNALAKWPFDHEGCNALARRLTGPLIHAQEDTTALKIPEPAPPSFAPSPVSESGACLALVATELEWPPARTHGILSRAFGLSVAETHSVQIDHPSANAEALESVSQSHSSATAVVVVLPAHRAPITAIALFLRKVTEAAGPHREVILLVTGRPAGDGFSPVPDQEFQHWRNVQAIHHLRVTLERLRVP